MLMACCEFRESNAECLKFILNNKPRINLQDSFGRTALHFACRSGRTEFIKILVKVKEIDVNKRTCGGETPLMYAA